MLQTREEVRSNYPSREVHRSIFCYAIYGMWQLEQVVPFELLGVPTELNFYSPPIKIIFKKIMCSNLPEYEYSVLRRSQRHLHRIIGVLPIPA